MENPYIPEDEDINEMDKNLYIGSLETACNKELLEKYEIKWILSVLQSKIPDKCIIKGIQYKYINVWDTEKEDIISYFPECFEFINSGQLKEEGVLVHCRVGRSRSATVIMAFIMKKYGRSLEDTYNTAIILRPEISPNSGFMNQLRLWQKLHYVLLGSDSEYRLVLVLGLKTRLYLIARFGQKEEADSWKEHITAAFICYLQKVSNAENNCQTLNRGNTYICKSCANELFEEINLIKHSDTSQTCNFVYIEPLKWILREIVTNAQSFSNVMNGEIKCVQCKELLGTYDWHSTYSCDCEAHTGLKHYMAIKIDSNKLNHY